jgi:hypothetical protein
MPCFPRWTNHGAQQATNGSVRVGPLFPFVGIWHGSIGDRLQIPDGQSILGPFDWSRGLVAFPRGETMNCVR